MTTNEARLEIGYTEIRQMSDNAHKAANRAAQQLADLPISLTGERAVEACRQIVLRAIEESQSNSVPLAIQERAANMAAEWAQTPMHDSEEFFARHLREAVEAARRVESSDAALDAAIAKIESLPQITALHPDRRREVCRYIDQQAISTATAELAERVKELEGERESLFARIYGDRELWCDLCDADSKQRAQDEADEHGVPVHVNVHGSRRFTAMPSRVQQLTAELTAARQTIAGLEAEPKQPIGALDIPCVAVPLTNQERDALVELSRELELPQNRVMIQALRHYQASHHPTPRLLMKSGDDLLCETCGIGFYLPSGKCDHCNSPRATSEGLKVAKQLTTELTTAKERIAELERENRNSASPHDLAAVWNVDSLTAKIREQKDEICQLHDIRSKLTAELTAAKAECERLKPATAELSERVEDLEGENAKLRANVGGGDTAIRQLQQENDNLHQEIADLREHVECLDQVDRVMKLTMPLARKTQEVREAWLGRNIVALERARDEARRAARWLLETSGLSAQALQKWPWLGEYDEEILS